MSSSTRIIVDEHEPEIDIVEPPFSPRPDVAPRKDKCFTDEFVVVDFLGRGKFGEVKRCRELATGREFAAKFIATPRLQDKVDVEREISTMRQLHHRRIVQLYDAFETKKEMCLILEIVYGGELFDRVITEDFLLTEKACICIVRQICEGLQFIHSHNIIHLDMKPENILCLSKTSNRIKIIDFGLARDYNPKSDTRVLFGTPEFMAPEVIQYDPIDFSTDMWSIGVICYVLLSGLSPFLGDNDHDTLGNVIRGRYGFDFPEFKDVSAEAKDMISRLLIIDKKKRISAIQCLEHPWLTTTPKPSTPTLDLSKIQLKHFVYQRKWQKAVNALIALKRMGVNIKPIQNGESCLKSSDVAGDMTSMTCLPAPLPSNCPPLNKPIKNAVPKQQGNAVVELKPANVVAKSSKLQTNPPGPTRPTSIPIQVPSPCTKTPSAPVTSPSSSTLLGRQKTVESKTSPETPLVNGFSANTASATASDDNQQTTSTATHSTSNRRPCHKAGDAAETFGNGHVFNLSKMIKMNRASHQHEEPSPIEIWQRDCRIAGGGTLGRRQNQQQPLSSLPPRIACATSVDDISRLAASITSDIAIPGHLTSSTTDHRTRNGRLPTVNDSSEVPTDCDDAGDVWNVCVTAVSNGVRSPPPPSGDPSGRVGNNFVRSQQMPPGSNKLQQTVDRSVGRSPSESGPSQSGPSQSGPSQPGPSQSGPSQPGPSQSGPSQPGPSQSGPSQPAVATSNGVMNGSASAKSATSLSPRVAQVWSSHQNTINAAGKSTKVAASPTLPKSTTTFSSGSKTTTAKDVALIKDRVRFFTKNESTQSTQSPPISMTTTMSSTTPTKSMNWFKRNNLFK